jgi:hypothetical protein
MLYGLFTLSTLTVCSVYNLQPMKALVQPAMPGARLDQY